jgi:hypothetical protein
MPEVLVNAHKANDKAVLAIFGLKATSTNEDVLSRIFTSYSEMSSGLLDGGKVVVKGTRKK